LREIRKYEMSDKILMLKTPFRRLVREITQDINIDLRFRESALDTIQQAAEAYLTSKFGHYQLAAVHGKRITIQARDIEHVKLICGD